MIGRLVRFVRARVARRFLVVFLLCAFLPLALVATLSFIQVRETLLQQAEQRLLATAKAYAMSFFERLSVATDVAATAAARAGAAGAGSREALLHAQAFEALTTVARDGSTRFLLGRHVPAALTAEQAARLATDRPAVRLLPQRDSAAVELLVPAGAGWVSAVVNRRWLWGERDDLPASTDFCIVAKAARHVVHCSALMPDAALRGTTEWEKGGERYLSRTWPQFMRAAFGEDDWLVVAAQPESLPLAKASQFAQIYIPAIMLTLLLVTWLTLRQSRDIVQPVERLAQRVRGIRDSRFGERLDLRRDDELGELSKAFEDMSQRMGSQFATLTALAEIDRVILTTQDTSQVTQTVLARLIEMTRADAASVVLLDRESTDHGNSTTRVRGGGRDGESARHEIGEADRVVLSDEAVPFRADVAAADGPGFLAPLRDCGMASAWVQPIVWRQALCGAVVLGFVDSREADDEEKRAAAELSDRMAVAVSSAWRDQQLYEQSHFDPVTGAPNRLLFRDRLALEIVRSQRESLRFALLFIDLDHFKNVNDSYGHSTGDAVLREAAARISRCTRASDSLARLGGDEFTVLLPHVDNMQEAWLVAETIVSSLSAEFVVGEQRFFLSASVGIASYPEDGTTEEALLKSADTAMYRAKAAGRAQAVFYEERMNEEAMARMALDRDLRAAIERGELELHYQPQRALTDGGLFGAEALVRWTHPVRGPIPPSHFIPLAEESGYIEALGQWIVVEACRQLAAWRDAGMTVPRVSVNVSPRQFRRRGFIDHIDRCVRAAGISAECLEIEVTEGLLMDRGEDVEAQLHQLAERGHRIALDDFGTGFSSMAYLKRFPVHAVKIDRVFVEELDKRADSEAIVAAIIAMAHALDKHVIAEGVETAGQAAILRRLGCDALQGYLWARPMPPADLVRFLREAETLPA